MAGTRLAIITTYVVQFALLFGISIYLASDSKSSLFGIYGGTIFVNRRGIGILESFHDNSNGDLSSILSHSLAELRNRVELMRLPFDIRISPVSIDGREYHLVESLRGGLDQIIDEEQRKGKQKDRLDTKCDIRVSVFDSLQTRTNHDTCDELSLRFGAGNGKDPRKRRDTFGYDIVTLTGCTDVFLPIGYDAKLSVDDFGDMVLSIRQGVSQDEISLIVRDHVARFIADEFIFPSHAENDDNYDGNAKPSWVESTSTLEVVITLLDEDPFSYVSSPNITKNTSNTPDKSNHRTRILQALSTAVSTHLHPMLQSRLSLLLDTVHLGSQSLPYQGDPKHPTRRKSSLSSRSTEKNGEYIVDVVHAKNTLLKDNVEKDGNFGVTSFLVKNRRNTWTAATNFDNADDDFLTFNFVVFVPPMDRLPLRVVNRRRGAGGDTIVSYGNAFSIPDRFTAVSIVNLDGDFLSKDNSGDHANAHYEEAVTGAISYFGSFVRESVGLSVIQPHRRSSSSTSTTKIRDSAIVFNHLVSSYGMTHWEVDYLLRTFWTKKALEVIDMVENVLSLIEWRKDLAFPIKSAENVNSCLKHMLHALDSIDKDDKNHIGRDIRQSTLSLNKAHRIAKDLSVDGDMVALPYLPIEQVLALLGSMTLPLILPFIVGVVRELKRYKELVAKKT